jgi:hypothetical protein
VKAALAAVNLQVKLLVVTRVAWEDTAMMAPAQT